MVIENFPLWLSVGISALALLYTVTSNRNKATGAKVRSLEERVDKIEDRATRIETDMRHLPDKTMIFEQQKAMAELSSEVRVLAERIKPIAAISDRLQEHLIEKVTSS